MIWDANVAQMNDPTTKLPNGAFSVSGSNSSPVATAVDSSGITYGAKLLTLPALGYNGGAIVNVSSNVDGDANNVSQRFRHMSDTVMNALFCDGHVAQFSYKYNPSTYTHYQTDWLRKNLYVNP